MKIATAGTWLRALLLGSAMLAGIGGYRGASAGETHDIPVIVPLTGSGSFAGRGQQQNLKLLEGSVNEHGGIRGLPLRFVFHDDQTSPQVAIQLLNGVLADRPPVVLGSTLVAMCKAMAPLVKNGPVLYCLSPSLYAPPGSFAFSSSDATKYAIQALVRYFRLKGMTRLATITTTDATGQDADQSVDAALHLPENHGMTVVDREHFNRTDVSVAAQITHIAAAKPQVIFAWTTGAPVATVFKGLVQAGVDLPVVTTSGNQTYAQMAQYADFLPKELYIGSAVFPEHDAVFHLDPRVEKAQHQMYAALKKAGVRPDNMTATSWDAGLIVVEALRKLGPKATSGELRKYIAGLTDFPGVDGIYNFEKFPQRGLGEDAVVVTAWAAKRQQWVWKSKPGGVPLDH